MLVTNNKVYIYSMLKKVSLALKKVDIKMSEFTKQHEFDMALYQGSLNLKGFFFSFCLAFNAMLLGYANLTVHNTLFWVNITR